MKSNNIFIRVGILLIILVLCSGIVALSVAVFNKRVGDECEECARAFEQALSDMYMCGAAERSEEQIDEIVQNVLQYLTPEAAEREGAALTSAAAELTNEVRSVSRYNTLFSGFDADFRYGGVRIHGYGVLDFSGYGGYIGSDAGDIVYSNDFERIYQMEKTDDGYRISAYKTIYQE